MRMEPVIPLKHAEALYVTLGVVIQELNRQTSYPTESLDLILHDYERSRSKYCKDKGWSESVIKDIQSGAVYDLHRWLNERAAQSEDAKKDLKMWEQELDHPSVD